MIIASKVEDHLRVFHSTLVKYKNPLGYNSPASQLYHRKNFILLTNSACTISACFIIDILMLSAEAFTYLGGHACMRQCCRDRACTPSARAS